jgi:5-methyltetrahydropteroyltriglutamate--homocysteine methyltransferase
MARGFQGNGKDVKALGMKKWFNTNYHYIVPEITQDITFDKNNLNFETLDTQILEAVAQSASNIKVSLIGPLTFLKLSKFIGSSRLQDSVPSIIESYKGIIEHIVDKCSPAYIQIEEPSLVTDLSSEEKKIFKDMYDLIIQKQDNILLQTYFGAPDKDVVEAMYNTNAKAIGLDFVDGKDANLKTIEKLKFPEDKTLFAGVINGRNIWRNDYQKSIDIVDQL